MLLLNVQNIIEEHEFTHCFTCNRNKFSCSTVYTIVEYTMKQKALAQNERGMTCKQTLICIENEKTQLNGQRCFSKWLHF